MNQGVLQIQKSSMDVSLPIKLRSNTTGDLETGVTITDLDLYYIRVENDADVTISGKVDLTALTALTDDHADNKAIEIGHGYYRVDLPDAVFADGATAVSIIIEDGSAAPAVLTATIDVQLVDAPAGIGSVIVDHDYGGTDALAYKTAGGVGIDNAVIIAYLKSDYDAGNYGSAFVKATTHTDVDGRWVNSMHLDPATYTLYYCKQGYYGPDTMEVTVE